MKILFTLTFCLLSFMSSIAQQPESQPPHGSTLTGLVVSEPGSHPLKKVLLQLIAEDQKQASNQTTTSDSDGRFQIEDVAPGRYRLFLEKTGFVQINERGRKVEGTVLNVAANQTIDDLPLRMLAAGVITGRVVDEDGDPLPNFNVSVSRRKPGKPTDADIMGGERTNDLGEYRISGLFPGQYYVVATPGPDFTNLGHPVKPSDDDSSPKADTGYVTTYYPGTSDSTQASTVAIKAGDEMPVNFTIVPSRTYHIRGIVTGLAPQQKPMVQLISRGANSLTMNAADVGENGRFEVRGVAPGTYWMTAYSTSEGATLTARQSVSVVAGDVDGLKLVPVRPFIVTGHLRLEGQSRDITHYAVYLENADDEDDVASVAMMPGSGPVARVDANGDLKWTGVTPGNYTVHLSGGNAANSFLKSVTMGNTSADTGLHLSGPATLDLVVGSRGGVLEGIVTDRGQPVANATVVAVPEEKYRKIREHFGVGTSDQNGKFGMRGLAPGNYTVYAWQDLGDGAFYDSDFLKTQEGEGRALTVTEGSRQRLEISLSPSPEEWQ